MSNHAHLIVRPEVEDTLAKTLGRAHSDYARYANVERNPVLATRLHAGAVGGGAGSGPWGGGDAGTDPSGDDD